MNQALLLYRLQQIDTQIDQSEASLAELERLLSGDEAVLQSQQAAKDAEKALHHSRQALKQAEAAVHDQQVKIGTSEASLYSGRIHNPKELQDLQKEIASLKKHLGVLEDEQLEAMMALEDAEKADQSAQHGLTSAQAGFAERSAGWLGQKDLLLRNLERLKAERSAALSLVQPDSLKVYEMLRKRKSGIAVTSIKEGSCTVCGTEIRPSELQTARAAQTLVYCTSCGRILYAG